MTSIGDRVLSSDLRVPIGTTITTGEGLWTREVDGWHSDNGRHYTTPRNTAFEGDVVGLVPYVETLAMHKQRFAVTCMTMGALAGGGSYRDGARDIINGLSLPDPATEPLRVGSWVSEHVNAMVVPLGAVVLSGARNRAEGHSLFVKREPYSWGALSGPRHRADRILTQVVALPAGYETTDWPEPAENEQDLIREFRIRSWEVGYRVKTDRGWCPDFENNISVLGLSERVARDLRQGPDAPVLVGAQCTAALMDAAPVGTVVTEGPGRFTATKESTCWRQWDTQDEIYPADLYFHPGLTFHTVPVGPRFTYGQRLTNAEQQSCPLGAVFAYPGAGLTTQYVMGRTDEGGRHGTRNIQPDGGADWGDGHRLIWDGTSPIHEVPVQDSVEMTLMPIGTVIGERWRRGAFTNTWTKTAADEWTNDENGRHFPSSQFVLQNLRYGYIPVPGVPRPGAPVEDDDEF